MPGFIIHIAVAQENLKKHNLDYNKDFIIGSVLPDFTTDKSKTHYGKSPAYTNLKAFLLNNDIETDLNKGKFLHLITDYLFYNYYVENISKKYIYDDYDKTNKYIIDKYNVKIIDEIVGKIFYLKGEPKILNFVLIDKIITEISNLDIFKVAEEVLNDNQYWNYYRNEI